MNNSNKWQLTGLCCLIAILTLIIPAQVLAAPPVNEAAETCVECHEAETEAWLASPHAVVVDADTNEVGATCEGCHGAYIEDHPEAGIMQLTVDSSSCEECHGTTFEQWENSTHADAGVGCIGCHKSHTLGFRLADSDYCSSCHRDRQHDFAMSGHGLAGVECIDCHLSSNEVIDENDIFISNRTNNAVPAPSHDFTEVSPEDCIECHTTDAHEGLPAITDENHVEKARMVAMVDSVPQLTAKLEASEHTNQSLTLLTPISLGIGLGIGGALGIASVMLFCFINQKMGANNE